MTWIVISVRPVALQITVVEGSRADAFALQIPAGIEDPNATAGWKIAVTVTLEAPAAPPIPTVNGSGAPAVPLAGALTLTERSLGAD